MKSKLLRLLKYAGIAGICLVSVYVVLIVVSGAKLRQAYDDLRKDGRPMTAVELMPERWFGATNNAAFLYLGAYDILMTENARFLQGRPDLPRGQICMLEDIRENPALEPDMRGFLTQKDVIAAMELIRQAAEKPPANFPVNWNEGPGALLPQIAHMRAMSRLMASRCLIEAKDGNMEAAASTLLTGLKMSNALKKEPVLISQLVRLAQVGIMVNALQDITGLAAISPARAEELSLLLAETDGDLRPSFVRAMDGERLLMGEWVFGRSVGDMMALTSTTDQSLPPMYLYQLTPLGRLDHAFYLRTMRAATAAFSKPYPEGMGSSEVLTRHRFYIISGLVMPAVTACRTKVERSSAMIRLARISLALRAHRAAHGAYPATLGELDAKALGDSLTDPFSGKPMLYRTEGETFKIYSVGDNGKDDGGKPAHWQQKAKPNSAPASADPNWDIVWEGRTPLEKKQRMDQRVPGN